MRWIVDERFVRSSDASLTWRIGERLSLTGLTRREEGDVFTRTDLISADVILSSRQRLYLQYSLVEQGAAQPDVETLRMGARVTF